MRGSLAALIATYLFLVWVASSAASRGQSFWFFLAGLLALAVALAAFARGRRKPFYVVFAASVAASTTALALELTLHVAPGLLPGPIANVCYTGYHWQNGGIYALDPHMGPVMKPNVSREMYWQGHWWQHVSNAAGYRGPDLGRADAIFLGDSMIYGHGVELDETVPSQFEAVTGLVSANLGQQGTCLIQSLIALEDKGVALRPRYVFLSSHFSDPKGATDYYPASELERFLARGTENVYRPRVRDEYLPPATWDLAAHWASRVSLPMRTAGIAGAVYRGWRAGAVRLGQGSGRSGVPFVPPPEELASRVAVDPEAPLLERLGWLAHVRAIEDTRVVADQIGAKLVLFDLGYPRPFSREIERVAQELGVEYNPAGRVALQRALAGEPIYLADDGHWTPEGSRVIAQELAKSVARREPRELSR